MLVLNLKLKCSFKNQKRLGVLVPVKGDALLWCHTCIKEGKGAVGVGRHRKERHECSGKVEGLPLPGPVSLHLLLPFLESVLLSGCDPPLEFIAHAACARRRTDVLHVLRNARRWLVSWLSERGLPFAPLPLSIA